MVIDWITVEVPLFHSPVDSGRIFKVLPGGEIDWNSPCRASVEGSYRSSIQVKSIGGDGAGQATALWISGNPSKFLQGHNVFGSEDILSLVYDTFVEVCRSLDISPTNSELAIAKRGNYRLKTIDICRSFELPTRGDCLAWLRAMEYKSTTRHGRPLMKGGTLYFGSGTARWKFKFYSKGDELDSKKKGHKLPSELLNTPIKDFAENLLRIELTLMSKELRALGVETVMQMQQDFIDKIYQDYLGRIKMSEQISLSTTRQNELPRKLQSTYLHWNNGVDLRSILPKATFYRHRRDLLVHGIDIMLRKETADRSNVIPLIRVLEATPVGVPEWAFHQGLVHPSAVRGVTRKVS